MAWQKRMGIFCTAWLSRNHIPCQRGELGGVLCPFAARTEVSPCQFDDVLCDDVRLDIHINSLFYKHRFRRNIRTYLQRLTWYFVFGSFLFRAGVHRMVWRVTGIVRGGDGSISLYRAVGGGGVSYLGRKHHSRVRFWGRGDSVRSVVG